MQRNNVYTESAGGATFYLNSGGNINAQNYWNTEGSPMLDISIDVEGGKIYIIATPYNNNAFTEIMANVDLIAFN